MGKWSRIYAVFMQCRRAGLLAAGIATQLAACAQPSAAAPPAEVPTAPRVQALLIGIRQYGEAGLSPLDGPGNDVALMREVLTTRFAVPASQVRLVLNPTHGMIAQEFAALRQRVRPHDFVYIHYSGHGSTAPDPNEPRGEDQTWVPQGARVHRLAGQDDWDVLDKEIAVWLAPLYALTDDVVFVSDSCHSGTVSRGDRRGVRSAEPVVPAHPLLGHLPVVPPPVTGLRIGAARDFETAVELDPRDGHACQGDVHCYGVFTWHWAQALRESRPGEAWGDVFNRASARITTQPGLYQRPQLEGRADRAVFGGRFAALTPTVEVTEITPAGVRLGAGALAGVTVDSTYRSVAPGAAPATLRVTEVGPLASLAQRQGGALRPGDLVTEIRHAYAAARIRLYLGPAAVPADAAPLARVREAIQAALPGTLGGFELVGDPAQADWWLQTARPAPGAATPPPGVARRLPDAVPCAADCPPSQLWVVSRQGLLMDELMRFELARVAAEAPRLVDNLHAFAWAQEVRRLGAQGNGTPLAMTVTIWRPPAGDTRSCAQGAAAGSGWTRLGPYRSEAVATPPRFNDCLAFEIENRSPDRTWYGHVVAVGPDQQVVPALPPADAGSDEARIPPGQRLTSNPARLYRLNTVGVETVLLLASDGPVRVQALQQSGLRDLAQSRLEALLATRAAGRGSVEAGGDWGAASVAFPIAAP